NRCSADLSNYPRGYADTITSGTHLTARDFPNYQPQPPAPGSVTGVVFDDVNQSNGIEGEDLLPGWTIRAYTDDGDGILSEAEAASVSASAVTDASGHYTLSLAPGSYVIC